PGFYRKVIRQEFYPLLEVKEKNAFADLPENLYSAIENLDCSHYIHEAIVHNDDPQVDNQEILIEIINSNENQNVGRNPVSSFVNDKLI
ncbi:23329_t:CDS:2, partial [Racocetra persica]